MFQSSYAGKGERSKSKRSPYRSMEAFSSQPLRAAGRKLPFSSVAVKVLGRYVVSKRYCSCIRKQAAESEVCRPFARPLRDVISRRNVPRLCVLDRVRIALDDQWAFHVKFKAQR